MTSVQRLEPCQLIEVGLNAIGELEKDAATRAGIHAAPRRKGRLRRGPRAIDIAFACHGDIRDRRIVMRIDAGQGLATGSIDEFPADEQLVPNRGLQAGSLLRALYVTDGTAH